MLSFEEITAPVGAERFKAEYLGKAPVHLEGAPERFAEVMSWEILNRLLGMSSIWAAGSLQLVLDKEPVPAASYCTVAPGRDGGQVLRPDPAKVKAFLRRGATAVANDIDQLTPELAAFSKSLEEAVGGKVQANLYLSSRRKQGFRVHFDTHDVFAVHCMGEKTWMVFEGRGEDPIAHPMFKNLGQEHHDKAKGALWKEVRLKPGHLLYLPRGQYHYALADDGPCVHIAFGVTYPIGLDVVSWLFERMVAEPLARANLPQGDERALADRLAAIAGRIAGILGEPATLDQINRQIAGFRYARETYDLPGLVEEAEERFAVRGAGMRLAQQGGRWALVKTATREAVEVPAAARPLVAWVLERPSFLRAELHRAFPAEPAARLDRFLADMQRMRLVVEEA
ncbi:cupin domain-containing protein [Geminicoccaceae bacterium 1502E]|nr:cupin domain-containing protein [Geminicoccaceae bacterium 1502E]